ncbi:MAG: hypothetical protein JSW34_12905 [Candidatus Zixiibacteriota bacterium]|nr:MAG: hypothetical protein JSW34_12905 [candidate division Zixibacteria bacterium]
MRKNDITRYTAVTLGLVPLIYWSITYLSVDLWYDEVYSFHYFALKGISDTLFHYPASNNHVLFNFMNHILSRVLGLRSMDAVMDHVYVFRGVQLLITIATAYYSLRIIRKFFYREYSYLNTIVLFTCIPFMNFSLQLRGYNMSSLFSLMVIYYSWTYVETRGRTGRIMIILSAFLLLYTIPSNLYFLAAFGITIFYAWLVKLRNPYIVALSSRRVLIFLLGGVLIAGIAYLPILGDIMSSKLATRAPASVFHSIAVFTEVIPAFLSDRYLLLFLLIPGLILMFKREDRLVTKRCLSLLLLLIFPFVISFVHQKAPFQRVFVVLSPLFCILLTIIMISVIGRISNGRLRSAVIIGVSVYCLLTFFYEIRQNNETMTRNFIEKNTIEQNISNNYYLSDFYHPGESAGHFSSICDPNLAVAVFDQVDMASSDAYLRKSKINFVWLDSVSELRDFIGRGNRRKFYIVTSHKNRTSQYLQEEYNLLTRALTSEPSLVNFIECEKP